jgi:hypothetical protein
MSLMQFLVMAVVALLVTIPVVLLVPRARASITFDLLLWAATLVVGFLLAWVVVGNTKSAGISAIFIIADTPMLPAIVGALAGALALNLPLWLADRFGGSGGGEIDAPTSPDTPRAADENPQDQT